MVEKCQATDQGIKTGMVQDTVGVELLIVEFSKYSEHASMLLWRMIRTKKGLWVKQSFS